MNKPDYVGTSVVRVIFLSLGLLWSGILVLGRIEGAFLYRSPAGSILSWVLGIFTALSLIYSFESIFSIWMKFAARLQKVVTGLLFSVIYLFIVPIFFLISIGLGLFKNKGNPDSKSLWNECNHEKIDLSYFEKMG